VTVERSPGIAQTLTVRVREQACRPAAKYVCEVRLRGIRLLLATLTAVAAALAVVASAPAAPLAFGPCGTSAEFACAHLAVPLDPSGAVPGTITLSIRRHRAPVGEARSAVIALAGGPGQSAIPFSEDFVETLGPVAATRDVIIFDQRGTGQSHPLTCRSLEHPALFRAIGAAVAACAAQLGRGRSFYTSAESVADIEAIRQAGGYEKVVLYGTSYGTKVAELYAEEHPDRVEALILDSVVGPNGPDPYSRSTFRAVPRVLHALCASGNCRGITRDPVRDLDRLVDRIRRGPLSGRAINGRGRPHPIPITSGELLSLLVAGDLAPVLRAELLTDVRAAAGGDSSPLARLLQMAGPVISEREERESLGVDGALYFATTCEEQRFPWSRSVSPGRRLREATAIANSIPAATFAPFAPATALQLGDFSACAGWPYSSQLAPPASAPLPAVPTLILSGTLDLRTPNSDARALAASIPGSQLVTVPFTGHSVLGAEPGTCARDAMIAMFAGQPVKPCQASPAPLELVPPPLPPLRVARVSPLHGFHGRVGRTLEGVELTLADLSRELALRIVFGGEISARSLGIGGLRSGHARLAHGELTLNHYSYIPGLAVSGAIGSGSVTLHVEGGAAAAGTLAGVPSGGLAGTLEGGHVDLPAGSAASAAIFRTNAPASAIASHTGVAGARRPGLLGRAGTGSLGPLLRPLP
jgi:pimeloyl-ACP methyl ester carboxylesterase